MTQLPTPVTQRCLRKLEASRAGCHGVVCSRDACLHAQAVAPPHVPLSSPCSNQKLNERRVGVCAVQREKDSMYGLTLIWALAAVYGQQEAPIIRISTLVRRRLNSNPNLVVTPILALT